MNRIYNEKKVMSTLGKLLRIADVQIARDLWLRQTRSVSRIRFPMLQGQYALSDDDEKAHGNLCIDC